MMFGPKTLRRIRWLEFFLYGGVSEADRDRTNPLVTPTQDKGIVTGYVTYNPTTGEVAGHDGPPPEDLPVASGL